MKWATKERFQIKNNEKEERKEKRKNGSKTNKKDSRKRNNLSSISNNHSTK